MEQPQGTVTDFQMVGSYPEESSFGAVAAWLENGTDIKAIIYAQNGSGSLSTSGVISVATGAVLDFRLSGEQPAEESNGAVIAWVENSGEIKAVIFQNTPKKCTEKNTVPIWRGISGPISYAFLNSAIIP